MIKKHGGKVEVLFSFQEAYKFLEINNNFVISTSTGKHFIARAAKTRNGLKVIRFFKGIIECARAYDCCWGSYYNCNRGSVGVYVRALDCAIKTYGLQ